MQSSPPTPPPLLTAARSTFEALALLLAEPLDEPITADALGRDAVAARVAFAAADASRRGTLYVAVSRDVADALCANMLGAPRADVALRRDAVGELANVVCGNVLPLAAGPEAVFHLAAPVVTPSLAGAAEAVTAAADAAAQAAWLAVEGGRALAVLTWGPGV